MFVIHREIWKGFETVVLTETSSGTSIRCSPASGAILNSFEVIQNGHTFNIIDSYSSLSEFNSDVEFLGFKGCKLSPYVCRLHNGQYSFAGNTYKVEGYYLKDHALHGLIYKSKFTVIDEMVNDECAAISMLYEYLGSDVGYPFKYDCIVTYKLQSNHLLTIITEIINKDEGLIPIQDGWHPYFTLDNSIDDLQLEFQSIEKVGFDNELIPGGSNEPYSHFHSLTKIGDKHLDNCFSLNFQECQPMCVLRNPEKNIQVEIHPDTSYKYLQIYTPAHRSSIAIENLSSIPDAFNNHQDLKILSPGEKIIFKTSYKITLLP